MNKSLYWIALPVLFFSCVSGAQVSCVNDAYSQIKKYLFVQNKSEAQISELKTLREKYCPQQLIGEWDEIGKKKYKVNGDLEKDLEEVRKIYACYNFAKVTDSQGRTLSTKDFVDGWVGAFHTPCSYYWQNQVACIWNMGHQGKESWMANAKLQNPGATCADLKEYASEVKPAAGSPPVRQ